VTDDLSTLLKQLPPDEWNDPPDRLAKVARAARRRRARWRAGGALTGVAALALAGMIITVVRGISDSPTDAHSVQSGRSRAPAGQSGSVVADPEQLVGLWRVSGAGEPSSTVLRLGDDLSLWRPCGVFFGDWRADRSGLFVGIVSSASSNCVSGPDHGWPKWLGRVKGFEHAEDGWMLVDSDHQSVAHLLRGGHPSVPADVSADLAAPPHVTKALRERFAPVSPLPAGSTPATSADVVGSWAPQGAPGVGGSSSSRLTLAEDGTWQASFTFNCEGGRWVVGSDGRFLLVGGGSSLVACGATPGWLLRTARVSVNNRTLTLYDDQAHVVGRLTRR
jgi:hypothetical protein